MQLELKDKDLATLLALYNGEVDTLRAKLLNGEPWEELTQQRKRITELAIAIHKQHHLVVSTNPAEFPQSKVSSEAPAE